MYCVVSMCVNAYTYCVCMCCIHVCVSCYLCALHVSCNVQINCCTTYSTYGIVRAKYILHVKNIASIGNINPMTTTDIPEVY